jgi:hypothetical protein
MKLQFKCNQCQGDLATSLLFLDKDTVRVDVEPCSNCGGIEEREPVVLDYDDLLAIVQDKVCIMYHKKNGSSRTMIGYLGLRHDIHKNLVYFVEREFDSEEPHIKCLLLDGIESVHQISSGLEIRIKGGYFHD